jgi:hypothetical protein
MLWDNDQRKFVDGGCTTTRLDDPCLQGLSITPQEVIERIHKAKGPGGRLDLTGVGLREVPSEVWTLTDLADLQLSNNKLTSLPEGTRQPEGPRAAGLGREQVTTSPRVHRELRQAGGALGARKRARVFADDNREVRVAETLDARREPASRVARRAGRPGRAGGTVRAREQTERRSRDGRRVRLAPRVGPARERAREASRRDGRAVSFAGGRQRAGQQPAIDTGLLLRRAPAEAPERRRERVGVVTGEARGRDDAHAAVGLRQPAPADAPAVARRQRLAETDLGGGVRAGRRRRRRRKRPKSVHVVRRGGGGVGSARAPPRSWAWTPTSWRAPGWTRPKSRRSRASRGSAS